jgi:uncharacterized protein YyaL (SSP411 family)
MSNGAGGFHASLDADSEGVEGLFYTWTEGEATEALGGLADHGIALFGITEEGNFEGRNVLAIPEGVPPDDFEGTDAEVRTALLEARRIRIRPALDDKAVCSWNALMISALAEAGAVLGREDLTEAATACAEFVWEEMRDRQGRLLRVWRDGRADIPAFLEDHAFLLEALLDLYQATFEPVWFERARGMAEEMLEFPGEVFGMALNLERDDIGAVIFGDYTGIEHRDFGRWSMAYVRDDEIDGKILARIRGTETFDPFNLAPGEAMDLLKEIAAVRSEFLARQQAAAES